MADEEETGEKPHEPTQRKLDKAREKGEIARSQDLTTAAGYFGICLAAMAVGGSSLIGLAETLQSLLDRPEKLAPLFFNNFGSTPTGGLIGEVIFAVLPLFAIPAVLALAVIIAQRAFVFSGERIRPKISKISIISNAKQKFGRNGIFEFFKSFTKLLIYSATLFYFVSSKLPEMTTTLSLDPMISVAAMMRLCVEFLFIVFVIAICIGGIDFLWQRAEHLRKNRMTDKEIRDEIKESEGDPYIKGKRRQKAEQIARSQMMKDVPNADVVIVNPTHYAVALKWERKPGTAPVCVAKGVDEIAHAIRRKAIEHSVPIHSDPPTARKLHTEVDIGQEIAPADYRAVAAAIRFADDMRKKAKGRI